jgi:CheY-like chemotaxis protein/nitrogen-specific signal transduction histidine kinase
VLSFSDITVRQQLDAEREAARQAAEKLAQIKSEFLANMSHEIRTPLNGVLGLAQIGYRDSQEQSATQNTFARILDSGKLLLTIINDILDFSKMEAGKLEVESVPFDPARVVDEAIAAIKVMAVTKEITLTHDSVPDLPRACVGDSVRVSQILLNLLSNAVKFTKAGEIRLSAGRKDSWLVFEVTDTGIGIPEEQIDRLFQPFEQADTTTTRKFGGTGLGLAISRRLADLMGGTLTATSTVGQGSTFTLRLPLKETDQPVQRGIRTSPSNEKRLSSLRILAADDNPVNQLVLEDFLTREGAAITIVGDGQQVVDAVSRGDVFDVVLMDVQMPVMDGLEATRRIREIAPNLPVIGQTAHALKEEHDKCLAAGMLVTITKPIDIDLLVATVLDHVKVPDGRPTVLVSGPDEKQPLEDLVVDWSAVTETYSRHPEFIDRLVDLTLLTHGQDADRLRTLIDAGHIVEIGKIAHSLKGLAGNLHATELSNVAIRVMHSVRAESPDVLDQARELAGAVERVIEDLRRRKQP